MVFGGLMVVEGVHVPPYLLRQSRDSLVELGYRLGQLLLPCRVRRQLELTLHLGPRESQRLELPNLFRVGTLRTLTRLAAFLFSFFHALGEARLRIDKPFSGITHILELCNAQCSMHNAQSTSV